MNSSHNPALRELLSESEIMYVDAYLRRFNLMLSTVVTLSQVEKQELVKGHRALCRLFYSTLGIEIESDKLNVTPDKA
jgi:hypothetical protein